MTKVLKRGMLRALKRGGAFAWLGHSQWRRQRLLILCFHGISNDDDRAWNPSLFMPPAVFRARMQLLKDSGCHVLPLTEAVARLYDHALPAQTVAITFDDGFYNFYE